MALASLRRVLVGPPLETRQLIHQRISKLKGMAVFSSDALSSTAYATEEILLVLVTAGAAALSLALPVAAGISAVLAIVAFSYYQTIHAYPSGGGAYIVAHDNLGIWPGLIAAAALLIDYVLTVSVSVAAGVAAVTSAVPSLFGLRVWLALGAIFLIAVINLRGVRESASIFAVPTYVFIGSLGIVIVIGLTRTLGHPPLPPQVETGGHAGSADRIPDPQGVRERLRRDDGRGGDQQRDPCVSAAGVTQRRHHADLDGGDPHHVVHGDHLSRASARDRATRT